MADEVDMANEQAEYHRQVALHRAPSVSVAASALFCDDCNEPIPEARRLAVRGCHTCIDCQVIREIKRA